MFHCWTQAKQGTICIRLMSAYPKHYFEPIYVKSQQNKCNKLIQLPTKATKNNECSSIFYNEYVKKMINYITIGGNKKLGRQIMEDCFEIIKRTVIERVYLGKYKAVAVDPCAIIMQSIENGRPLMQLTAIKRGGVTYLVPIPVTEKRSYFLAIKWILEAAKEKDRNTHLPEKLAWEILDAAHGQGRVIKRKNDLHKQCEGNRAYAHYRWS